MSRQGCSREARAHASSERQRYEYGDASALAVDDGAFDLVAMVNMIPFYDEIARVTAPGGRLAIAFSRGPTTPIWVPFDRLRRQLARRGFSQIAEIDAPPGMALLATKADRS